MWCNKIEEFKWIISNTVEEWRYWNKREELVDIVITKSDNYVVDISVEEWICKLFIRL